MKRLKYLAAVNPSLPREQIPHPDTRVSFLPMERISEDGKLDLSEIRCAKQVSQGYTSMLEGDLIIAKITPCFENGKGAICSGLFGGIGYGTTELIVLRAKSEADRRFLYWLTLGTEFRKRGEAEMRGSAGQKRVTEEFVSNFQTSIRKADQLRIASYLDEATGRIDRLVGLRRRQIELLREQRTALIQETVTRGLNPSAPLKDSGIPWLGAIPEHWEVKRLKYFGFFKGGAGFPHEDQGNDVGEIPFIKVKALSDADAEGVLRIADDYVSHETAARLGAFVFPTNTVVFAKVGAALLLNRFRAIGQPTCIDNNMMGLVVDHRKAEWHFLLYVLSSLDFAQMVNPGPVPSLNEPQISNQKIGLPPLEEQREILAHIQRETAKLDALHLNYERQLALLAEYRAALIHECVTGQKVVD